MAGVKKGVKKEFTSWPDTFQPTLATCDYFTDFEKVNHRIKELKPQIKMVKSILKQDDILLGIENILQIDFSLMSILPLFVAVNTSKITFIDTNGQYQTISFNKSTNDLSVYMEFIKTSGIVDVLKRVKSVGVEKYLFGILVGMDSNTRKNRMGRLAEDKLEEFLQKTGNPYYKEVTLETIKGRYNVDISQLSNHKVSSKRFDYVMEKNGELYLFESSYYTSSGSKQNELSRSYTEISKAINEIKGLHFIWVVDGMGWKNCRHALEQAYYQMPDVYNFSELEEVFCS